MNLVQALSSAISDKNLAALPTLRAAVQAELAKLEGKSSKNYANHLRSLLRELESVIPDAKSDITTEAKPKNSFASNSFLK